MALEPRRSLEALPRQARPAGWFARSFAGYASPSAWVVEPFGLTRGWRRSPQLPHSHPAALPSGLFGCTDHNELQTPHVGRAIRVASHIILGLTGLPLQIGH